MAGIPLALNFDLGAPLPLDSRIVIAQFSQLNNINPKYSGMQAYAADTKKLYYLEDLPSNKWTEVITNSNLPSLPTSLVYTTGNQTIGGVKTFSNTIGGSIDGNAATVTNGVYTIGNQTIGGEKTFSTRPKVGISGVLLQGEIPSLPDTLVYTTGNQSIIGEKGFGAPTYFTDLLEASTDKLIFNNIYTGRVPEDFDMNSTTLGTSVGMSSDGTILGIGVNNYLTGSGDSIPSVRPLTGLLAKCYIYTRNENTSDWVFKEEISRQVPAATNVNFPRLGVQSVNFNSDGSILFFGFDEKIEIYTGSKNTTWNNLIQTLSGEFIISGGGTFGGRAALGNGISFSRNCSCIAVAEAGNDSLALNAGKIYLYTGSVNTRWALKDTLVPPVISQVYQSTRNQFYGKPKFNDDGSVLFLGRGLGLLNTNSIDIYTGSSSNGWTLKQNLIISGDPLFGVVATDSWLGANIDCNQDGTVFIFSKNNNFGYNQQYASVDIWSGNKNNGWQFKNSLFNTRNGSHNGYSRVFLSRDNEYIIHTEPSQGGDTGGINFWKRTSEFNYTLSQNIYSSSALAPFVPNIGIPTIGLSIGGGMFGFSFASDDNFNNVLVGAPQANILWGRPGCVGDLCASDLGYAVSFNLRKQSLKLNSQETNAPLLEINGEMIIDSPFRPKYNNSGILVQGDAVPPDSDAQLNSLSFKNSSTFSEPGPYFRSRYKGSGIPSSIIINSEGEGVLADFTVTGTNFTTRPKVNGSGVLLQGEASESTPNLTNVVFTTGDQEISGNKNFISRPTVNNTGIVLQGETLDAFFGNRPIRRLPVADTNYGGTTISGFLTNLFFPYLNTTIGLNPFSIYTYGIDSLSSINFSSTITSNDDTVTGLAAFRGLSRVGGVDPISVNGTQTISQTATLSPNVIATTTSSCLSRVYITRSGVSTNIASNNLAIRFEPRYYFGLSANTSLTSSQITGLQNIIGPNTHSNFYNYAINGKPTNLVATFNNPVNQYLYLVYPGQEVSADSIKDWGSITSIVDTVTFQQYTNEFEALSNVTVNLDTKTLIYRVHRSKLTWNINASFNLQFNL